MRAPATALGCGLLFPLLDPDALLSVTFVSRMPTDDEYARMIAGAATYRMRRRGEEHAA